MFRCITKIKGLVIDADSFDINVTEWENIVSDFQCVFMTAKANKQDELLIQYGNRVKIQKISSFIRFFAPTITTHKESLAMLGVLTTEMVYVSSNIEFLKNAMSFMSGAVWIAQEIDYVEASGAPDLICPMVSKLSKILKSEWHGFLGEEFIYPNQVNNGMIVPITIQDEEKSIPLYTLGRYFSYQNYMNQLHPYSSAIFLNKKENGKAYGVFNDEFAKLFAIAIKRIMRTEPIDAICSVPTRPGKTNRFESILSYIAEECEIENIGANLRCVSDYASQKTLNMDERAENVKGAFNCNCNLEGKNVVIIDDIISTGATVKECVRELEGKGANQVYIVVLAINQYAGATYWSSEVPMVKCPSCGEKMHLLINSYRKSFFYSCYNCNQSISFENGQERLVNYINETK